MALKEPVKVTCNLRRFGGTVIDFGGKAYHFKPEGLAKGAKPADWPEDAPHVCLVDDEKALKRLASKAMNGAYTVPGYTPEEEALKEIENKPADEAQTLDAAIAEVGPKLLEGGEYHGREDYVAKQMADFFGFGEAEIRKKLDAARDTAAKVKAQAENDKRAAGERKAPPKKPST